MLLLATQAEPQMRAHRHPNLGRLLQPRHYPRAALTARSGVPWAADNDAFNADWDQAAERRFLRMVQTLSGLPGCLFVVCPDVVGEAGLTSMLFEEYAPLLYRHGLPPAYRPSGARRRVRGPAKIRPKPAIERSSALRGRSAARIARLPGSRLTALLRSSAIGRV